LLVVAHSNFHDNQAFGSGGGIYNAALMNVIDTSFIANLGGSGAGIFNTSEGLPAMIDNSAFIANNAGVVGPPNLGGGINNQGTLFVTNSTFTANSAFWGGGIYHNGSFQMIITNSTLNADTAVTAGELYVPVATLIPATVKNTILANSLSGGECFGPVLDGGNNLDSGVTCGFGPGFGSLSNTNPLLGPMTGQPAYFPLTIVSPAIDAVIWNAPNNCPGGDQRGMVRPQYAICDIGAYELDNYPPKDITLSNNSLAENQPAGTTVGTLTTTDPDVGDTHTYSFACTVPGADDASFAIAGNALNTAAVFDYETKSSYNICLRTDDGNLGTFDKNFSITVTDANDAPTDITLTNNSVAENLPAGTTVGTLSTTDQDTGDTHTYSFACTAPGADDASFAIAGNALNTAAVFDYETKSTYNICIRTTDSGGGTFDKNFSITVTDANDAPTDITLSNNSVAENLPAGTPVGTLSTTDPDAGDTHTYSFACTVSGADDASFAIAGNALNTAAVFNYETKSTYNICIRTNDGNGGAFDKNFSITVTDANDAPTGITLSINSVAENRPAGTPVGTLTTTDPDAGDTHTYSFACTVRGVNDASFTIAGNTLKTAAVFNYETKNTYSICIRTNDGNGGTFDKNFTISITDLPETFTSTGAYDGWILESTETSGQGGTLQATDTTFRLGDEAGDQQYRSILSFNTAGLPDTAVILKVTLRIKKMAQVGTNPFTFPTGLKVDIRKNFFGTSSNLVITDFQAAVSRAAVGTFGKIPSSSNWYTAILSGTGYPSINKTGTTQFRLYFLKDDNDDGNPDYLKFASGNYATVSSRPTLIIEYYVP